MSDRSVDDSDPSVSSTEWSEADSESRSSAQYTLSSLSLSSLWSSLRGLAFSFWTAVGPTAIQATESAASPSVDSVDSQASRRNSSLFRDVEWPGSDGNPVDSAEYADHPLLGVESELLNPERRILQLLLVEGGTLAQSEIVERSRWSDSTISRTLCRMEAQGRVVRRQDGGGKLVILPQNNT